MEMVTDYFRTLFTGVAMHGMVIGPVEGIYQPPQQEQAQGVHEVRVVEDPQVTEEGLDNVNVNVDSETPFRFPSEPVGEYLILWLLMPDICLFSLDHTYKFCKYPSFIFVIQIPRWIHLSLTPQRLQIRI